MYEIRFCPFLLRVSLAATALPLIANVIGRSRAFHPSALGGSARDEDVSRRLRLIPREIARYA